MRGIKQWGMRLCLLLAALCLSQCSAPVARIDVQLTDLPPDAASLEVTLLRPGTEEPDQEKAVALGGARVILYLTQPAPQGVLIQLRALGADRCLLARGEHNLAGPLSGEYTISVALQAGAQPSCQLHVSFSGLGQGSVELQAEDPSGARMETSSLTQSLMLRYPKGTRITLRQYPELSPSDDNLFQGWAGACVGMGLCRLTIGDERLVVEPSFAPRRLCTTDTQHPFCWENPLPQGNALRDVWAASSDEVWAVGGHGTVLRWNGSFWLPLRGPAVSSLSSVWGDGQGQVWVSGTAGMVQRWSDGSWHAEATLVSSNLNLIRGIRRATGGLELWAIGESGVLLRRSGSAWQTMSTGLPGSLNGLSVQSERDVWIVGKSGVALHWNGESLQSIPTGVLVTLYDVWGSGPNDVWAVGDDSTLLHWDGTSWRRIQLESQYGALLAIWGTTAQDIWIATRSGDFWHYDGAVWLRGSAGIAARLPALHTIHGSGPDSVWFVGDSGHIYRWNGVYLQLSSGSSYQDALNNLWLDREGRLIASGDHGTAYQRSGDQWFLFAQPTNRVFFKIVSWGTDDQLRIGVTVAGELGLTVDSDWQFYQLGVEPGELVVDVFAPTPQQFWVVGSKGTLVRCVELVCSRIPSGVTTALLGVWGSSPSDIWFVGAGGVILRWDGTSVSPWASSTSTGLWSLWGRSAQEIWAVGVNSTVLHWDGSTWKNMSPPNPTAQDALFTSVWASGPADVWVSSQFGWLYHFDGAQWTRVETGFDGWLSKVYGTGPGEVWAVGVGGAILKRRSVAR